MVHFVKKSESLVRNMNVFILSPIYLIPRPRVNKTKVASCFVLTSSNEKVLTVRRLILMNFVKCWRPPVSPCKQSDP